MPITPRVVELANAFRAQLLAQERASASAMVRYYGIIWRELQADIDALAAEVKRLQDAGQTFSADKIYRLERMRNVQRQVAQELEKFTAYGGGAISAAQREAIAAGERSAYRLTLAAFPPGAEINVRFWRMPAAAVETMVGFVADGTPLEELIRGYVGDAANGFLERLVTGLAMGQNPREIAYDLRSAFGMGLTKALQISRTEQLRAYRTATLASYNANGNIVKGWQRHAARDASTCAACLILDGKLYTLAEEMDDHPNGRCALLPVTKTYAELGIDAPEPQFVQESGREWLERQDEATQREILGNGVYEAWKDGHFGLDKIPHRTHNKIWGDSWTPRSLYDLLGEDGPIRNYSAWKDAQE